MTVVLILSIKYQTLRSVPVRPTANLHDCQKPDFKSNVPIREIRSQYVLIVLYSIEAKADQCLAKYLSFFASCARSRPIPGKSFRHMGLEWVLNRKKTPIFFVDAKQSQIAQGFQKCKF